MSTIYLDNNIFISIQERRNQFDNSIISKIVTSPHDFYYSSAHIQESNRVIEDTTKIEKAVPKKRFDLISLITSNKYLEYDSQQKDIRLRVEFPMNVYETIHTLPFGQSSIDQLLNLSNKGYSDTFREQKSLIPERLNNCSIEEIVEKINETAGGSLKEFIKKVYSFFPDSENYGMYHEFGLVFNFLDMMGFWKDKENYKSDYARLWDSIHSYFATSCDYFVSDDKRTREKAKVVYHLYDVKTEIINSEYFINMIQ